MKQAIVILIFVVASLTANTIEKPLFLGTYGKTFEPIEKDMYIELKEKFQKFQKDNNVSQMLTKIMKKRMFVDMDMPSCKKNDVRSKELIYEVKKDVIFQGVTIARKGQKFNLLKRTKIPGLLVFSNYVTKKDKKALMTIIDDYDTSLRIYITKGQVDKAIKEIAKKFPHRDDIIVGKTPKIFLKRMGIKCVPSVVYQQNYKMVITELEVKNDDQK